MIRSTAGLRVFALSFEAPLAYVCVGLAATTLVWKTVGLDVLPGWEDMFGGIGAQYPRRVVPMSRAWQLAYLAVYGCLGTAATIAGLVITRCRGDLLSPAGTRVSQSAKLLGFFHVILGIHHTLWSVTGGAWGHLTLEQFEVPGLYVVGGIGAFATGLHGLRLLLSSSDHLTLRIVRSKIAVDGVSLLTFISVFVCFAMNALGMERRHDLERLSWTAVFVAPVLWLLADIIVSRSPGNGEPSSTRTVTEGR